MTTLARQLKALRDQQVWTQEELAERSGVPVVTISRIENGYNKGTPRQSTIAKLAKALDVTPTFLMFGEEVESLKAVA